VADVDIPEWKKKALKENLQADAAPFGMTNWNVEASTSATNAANEQAGKEDHGHSHEHGHGHGHS
jgi:hypothetical protein